jgi:hypothetical protein
MGFAGSGAGSGRSIALDKRASDAVKRWNHDIAVPGRAFDELVDPGTCGRTKWPDRVPSGEVEHVLGAVRWSVSMSGNDEQRERLASTIGRLTAPDYDREAMPGWTIGAVLAHLAFWDRLVIERWKRAIADDATIPVSLSDVLTDLINDGSLAQWLAMPGPLAGREAVAAAEAVDQYVEGLEDARVAAAEAAGLGRLIDRSLHRAEHLDMIDAALR